MTVTYDGLVQQVSEVDCVREYFRMKGDIRLFQDIQRAHNGDSWFEQGLALGYPLSLIHAIAARTIEGRES